MTGRRLTPTYAEFVRTVSRALYDVDPEGIGSSIDAPPDEYDDLAHRLAADLVAADTAEQAGRITTSLFASAGDALTERLWLALQRYRANSGLDA